MDMDRELREARAARLRAAIKAAAPAMRRDFWEMKRQQEAEGSRFLAANGR